MTESLLGTGQQSDEPNVVKINLNLRHAMFLMSTRAQTGKRKKKDFTVEALVSDHLGNSK